MIREVNREETPQCVELIKKEIVYICRRWRGEPKAVDGEMEELRFFPCEQIDLDEIHPPIRRVVEEFTAKQKNRF